MRTPPARTTLAAWSCAALLGCGSPRLPPPAPAPEAGPATPPATAFERERHARAHALLHQRRLADAAIAWEVLVVLRPDVPEYGERLADTRRQIDAAIAELLPRAAAAARRGDLDAAARQYLAVLALRPDDAATAEALRGVERERNRRDLLGRPARLTLLRPGAAAAALMSVDEAARAGNDIEHAALLADQDEVEAAVGLLRRRLADVPSDTVARRLLDELLSRRAAQAPEGASPASPPRPTPPKPRPATARGAAPAAGARTLPSRGTAAPPAPPASLPAAEAATVAP